jgi:ABC-2 type transport system permease protein
VRYQKYQKYQRYHYRFYIEVARAAFRRQLVYRWTNLAGLATNIFFGAIFSYVMIALFRSRQLTSGYSVEDALRYIWLVQALIMVVVPFGWTDLMLTIRSGDVVADLTKPCDFYWYWFSREVGRDGFYFIFRAVPIYIGGMLLFGYGVPSGWSIWLNGSVFLVIGAALGIAFRFLYNIIAFWIIEARAMVTMGQVIATFFSGSYIPIAFMPLWLKGVVVWLPFNGMMNVTAEIFAGKLLGGALIFEFLRQLGWLVVLTMIARVTAASARRRVVLQGG